MGIDVVLVYTAGRMKYNEPLMSDGSLQAYLGKDEEVASVEIEIELLSYVNVPDLAWCCLLEKLLLAMKLLTNLLRSMLIIQVTTLIQLTG